MARHTTQGLSTVVRANSSYINGVQKCLHNFLSLRGVQHWYWSIYRYLQISVIFCGHGSDMDMFSDSENAAQTVEKA